MRYPLAANTYSYIWRYGVADCLERMRDQGLRAAEILLTEPHCWPTTLAPSARQRVQRLVAGGGFSLTSLNLGATDNNLASPIREVRTMTVDFLKASIELAADWGARAVVLAPGLGRPLLPPPAALLAEGFQAGIEQLLPHAERFGVDLLVENVPIAFLPRVDTLKPMLDRFAHPRLGACYDVANALFAGEEPHAGLQALRQHVRLVHFSDTPRDAWRHDRIGTGAVRFDLALQALDAIGYGGPIVLEIIDTDGDAALAQSAAALAGLMGEGPR